MLDVAAAVGEHLFLDAATGINRCGAQMADVDAGLVTAITLTQPFAIAQASDGGETTEALTGDIDGGGHENIPYDRRFKPSRPGVRL